MVHVYFMIINVIFSLQTFSKYYTTKFRTYNDQTTVSTFIKITYGLFSVQPLKYGQFRYYPTDT